VDLRVRAAQAWGKHGAARQAQRALGRYDLNRLLKSAQQATSRKQEGLAKALVVQRPWQLEALAHVEMLHSSRVHSCGTSSGRSAVRAASPAPGPCGSPVSRTRCMGPGGRQCGRGRRAERVSRCMRGPAAESAYRFQAPIIALGLTLMMSVLGFTLKGITSRFRA
jgi:hypothetical protein